MSERQQERESNTGERKKKRPTSTEIKTYTHPIDE